MKNSVIFYFSGTGNSLQVARDLRDGLKEDSELISIGSFDWDTEITAKRVGLVFPVYCWGLPHIVEEFAAQMRVSSDTEVFAVVTYGGIAGAALDDFRELLEKRQISLHAAYRVKMPGNYIVSYGARSEKVQEKLFRQEKEAVRKITDDLNNGRENIKAVEINPLFHALCKKIYVKLMVDSRKSDVNFHVDSSCTHCGLCEKVCPVGNITMENGSPVWNHHCEQCMACIQRCPAQAINYKDLTQKRKRYVNPNVKFI